MITIDNTIVNKTTIGKSESAGIRMFGIKPPDSEKGQIWWITASKHASWLSFFTYPNEGDQMNAYRLPLDQAIKAYESIGYRCVELELNEV